MLAIDDLPDPDSPTSPSVSPALDRQAGALHRLKGLALKPEHRPSPVDHLEVADLQQRRRHHHRATLRRRARRPARSAPAAGRRPAGSGVSQAAMLKSQRFEKAASAWPRSRSWHVAANGRERRRATRCVRHGREQPARIGMARVCEEVASTSAISTISPAYMTLMRSQMSAATARSWVTNSIAMPNSSCRSRKRSRISCCTVTSSAVVGSSAISSDGLQLSARAMATRCAMPPDSSCG